MKDRSSGTSAEASKASLKKCTMPAFIKLATGLLNLRHCHPHSNPSVASVSQTALEKLSHEPGVLLLPGCGSAKMLLSPQADVKRAAKASSVCIAG